MNSCIATTINKLLILLFPVFISSCGTQPEVDEFSSPKALYIDYISAYTSGVISNQSPIKIRLARAFEKAVPGQELPIGYFSFEPKIEGSAFWEDERTIIFKPTAQLPSGKTYHVTFALDELFKTELGKDKFNFRFATVPQNFDIEIEGLHYYSPQDLSKVKITGTVVTADFVNHEILEKLITANQNEKALDITWRHADDNEHLFTIEKVDRSVQEESVEIKWDGQPIGVEKDGDKKFIIPSIHDFKVVSVNLIRGEEHYISVKFSDPILESQNLRGLVTLRGISSNPRMVADLNEVKIFPSGDITGEVDIDIAQGIKNSNGSPLKNSYSTSLLLEQTKPDIKITANSGTIMPGHQNLVLPFEAVSLNAVEVQVLQIFDENVLQYLQVNSLGGTRELTRVGRKVARKTVSLKAMGVPNLGQWNRFTLDLAKIFTAEPGAIYQITLNFDKKHSLYFCGTTENHELSQIGDHSEEEAEDYGDEESYWDYYDEDYYYYTWEERNDPCSEGYYRHKSGKSKIVLSSDIGVIAKHSDGGDLHIFTTQITSAKPQMDVLLEIYNFQQQKIADGKTDREGKAIIKYSGKPFAIIARKDNQVEYLKVDDGSSLSLSNFDVGGTSAKRGIKGFIYGERGVWRPADTLHLAFILEDAENRLPANYPVIMELYDPQGKLFQRSVSTSPSGKIYYFPMATSTESPTGNWMAKVKAVGSEFQKQIKIETVKPNRLKINLDFGRERLTYLDKEMSGDLNVRWLHGATAGNLKANFEVLLVPTKTTFADYPNVTFDDPSKEFTVENESIFEGRIDKDGYAKINFSLSTDDEAPGALNAIFKGKVFEEGGDFSIDKVVIPFYPFKSFVGIRTPEGDKRGMLLTDKDHSIRVVSVDAYGKPVSRQNVEVEVYKLNWRWWWDNSHDYLSNYVGRDSRTPIAEGHIDTYNGEGTYNLNVKSPEWGRFYIKVTDPESGHSAGKIVYLDWPGWAGKSKGGLGGASMLSFETDKQEYKTSEKIKISFPSSVGGRALISLETGSKVLQAYWVDTEQELTTVEFEATADMAPTIYAHISLIQPHAQTANDLPIRMYGIQPIKVIDDNTRLNPVIDMDKELQPEQQFAVKVMEAKGKEMSYTIAIVDDGLLDLTKFKTPDPWSKFYSREALGVKTWDIYDDVIGAYGGQLERLLAVGGDDEIAIKDEDKANRFKPVVMFKGPFILKAGEEVSHTFKMPQYVGSVRTMVIAANKDAYGFAEKTIPVKQPLMILATLPRVAGPGEKIKLPVNIFAMDENIRNVDIYVTATGKLKVDGVAKKTVDVNGKDSFISFDLMSSAALGVGKVKVTAKCGSLTANYDVELDVRASNPMMTMVEGDLITAGASWNKEYKPLGLSGTNDAVVETSTLPSLNLEQRIQFLIQYPHGCLEQTTSSVFPQLYLSELTNLDEKDKLKIEDNIKAGINQLKLFQRNSGGFTYWPGGDDENSWATNYAGHFLISAKNKGYNVPEAMINSWKNFQKDKADQWTGGGDITQKYDELIQSYRLLTLAMAGEPSLGAMNRMRSRLETNNVAKWQLALSYALAGHKDEANKMVEGITREVSAYNHPGRTFGSSERDKAIILQALIQLEREEEAFELVQEIAEAMGDSDHWMSTQTTAYCLLAVADYAKHYKISEGANVEITMDGTSEALNQNNFITQLYLQDANKAQQVSIINKGEAPVYVRMIRRGIPLKGNEQEAQNNIKLSVIYKTMAGEVMDISKLKQGTDFQAEVTIHNPGVLGDYNELALTQIFPSGWEIINTRLDNTQSYYQQDAPEYQDIRDDRVYTYFDLKANERKVFNILLNASYIGEYYLPGTSIEAMYDNRITATKPGQEVQVIR